MADIQSSNPGASPDAQSTEQKNQQSSGAPSASGQRSANPTQAAANEVLNKLPGAKEVSASLSDDVEDDGSDLSDEDVKKAEQKLEKLRKKLKVGGKEIEVDEDELVKRAQMGYSAEEKWQEASKMRKQVESFITMLQNDPAQALEKMGFDVDAMAEQRIQQRIEEMKKSPEQLELERIRRENETIKAERERERNELQQREVQRMQEQYAVQIENDINSALDAPDFGLPKSPYFVKRIADVMIYGLKNNKEISAKRAAEIVRNEVKEELQQMYQMTPDEVFEQMIGKDRLNKYRRAKITKAKPKSTQGTAQNIQPTGAREIQQTNAERNAQAAKVRSKDFFKKLGSK